MKKVSRMIADRLRGDIQRYKHELYFPMIRAIGDPLRLRFFDESGFQCKYLGRKRGRAPRGERLYLDIANPSRRFFTLAGVTSARPGTAPFLGALIEGGMHGEDVIAFFSRPEIISSFLPGDVLIWDNCRTHHTAAVLAHMKAMLATRGATLAFLPQYYPTFNPIELQFGWIKGRLSHCCDRGDYLSLLEAIRGRIDAITIDMMQGWYNKALEEMRAEGF